MHPLTKTGHSITTETRVTIAKEPSKSVYTESIVIAVVSAKHTLVVIWREEGMHETRDINS